MSDRLSRMKANNLAKIDIMDGASAEFIKSLSKTLVRLNIQMSEWTRQLEGGTRIETNQRNLSRAVNSRTQIEEMLLEAGYRDSTTKLMRAYDDLAEMSMRGFKHAGLGDPFSATDARAIVAIKNLDLLRWERQGQDLAIAIQEHLLDGVVGGSTFRDLSDSIAKTLVGDGDNEAAFIGRAETIANTTMMGFDRTISNRQAEKAGINTFVYLGPDDGLTRPFCRAVLDGGGDKEFNIPSVDGDPPIYTVDDIDGMNNRQDLPVAQYGGGYNCRHSFSPISVEVAQEVLA